MIEVEEKYMYIGGIYRIADEQNPFYGYRDIYNRLIGTS